MTTRIEASLQKAAKAYDADKRLATAIAPYRRTLEQMWGDEFEPLCRYLAIATAPWRQNASVLLDSLKKRPAAKTLVLVGQRNAPEDSSSNDQLFATLQTVKMLGGGDYHLLFTGGVYGLESLYGERPAHYLLGDFNKLTSNAYVSRCSTEQFSQNTGHQARVIGEIVRSIGFDRVVVCIPNEHIARFSATLAWDLHERRRGQKPQPSFIFMGNGDWEDELPKRGTKRHREAFGPLQKPTDSDAFLVTKLIGAEYEEKLYKECSPENSSDYVCAAAKPSLMLKEFVFTP